MNPLRRKHPGWSVGSLFAAAEEDSSDSFCCYRGGSSFAAAAKHAGQCISYDRTFQVLTNWVGGFPKSFINTVALMV